MLTDALAQFPGEQRSRLLVRGESGAGVDAFVHPLHELGLHYSVGLYAHQPIIDALCVRSKHAWRGALDGDDQPGAGAQVAELTRWLRSARNSWPPGMRVIARRERPHPGAQLRLTDGWRITVPVRCRDKGIGGRTATALAATGCVDQVAGRALDHAPRRPLIGIMWVIFVKGLIGFSV